MEVSHLLKLTTVTKIAYYIKTQTVKQYRDLGANPVYTVKQTVFIQPKSSVFNTECGGNRIITYERSKIEP